MLHKAWIYANLLFSFLQIPVGFWLQGAFGKERSPVIPAGYAFSIWSLIFAGSLVYSIYLAAPAHRNFYYLRKIAPFTAVAFFLSCLWMVVAKTASDANLWLTIPVIIGLFTVLALAFFSLHEKGVVLNRTEKWCILYPVSLYFGWVSVALFANIASIAADQGFMPLWFSILLVALAGSLTAWITFLARNTTYGLAALWGLIGIVITNVLVINSSMIGISILMSLVILFTLFKSFR